MKKAIIALILFISIPLFGQIKFEDVTKKAGLVEPLKGIAGHCAVFGDANGDDYPELCVGTFTHFEDSVYNQRGHTTGKEPNKFFINNGNGTFVEDKECPSGVKGKCSGGAFADLDNDGKMDICTSRYKNFIYKNIGVEKGIPKFAQPLDAGTEAKLMNYWAGGSFADFDRDGRLDFFGPEWFPEDKSRLMRNVTPDAGNYIDVKLELGKIPNRNGIGAKVEIFKAGSLGKQDDLLGTHIISVANGYSSGYEAIAHFGLPDDEKVDIRVTMPCNGPVFTARKVDRNQLFKLKN